ncbi:hypothetical protein ABI59_14345 [Acidobacteria bacterium Mor1]|nr:hypothetical protein ABI59_14345 [Acidobacteria bacterium Mor1]
MLDSFDRAILEIVQRDNQRTHADIGRQVNLSPSSVRRRLARLRKEGVIQADVALLSLGGESITAIVRVSFQQESLEANNAFKRRMQESPEVSQCYAVSGETDFILVVHAATLADYEAWGERTLMSDPAIRRYDTHIVWSRVKFSTAIPL